MRIRVCRARMCMHVFVDSLVGLCIVCYFTVLCQVCKHFEIEYVRQLTSFSVCTCILILSPPFPISPSGPLPLSPPSLPLTIILSPSPFSTCVHRILNVHVRSNSLPLLLPLSPSLPPAHFPSLLPLSLSLSFSLPLSLPPGPFSDVVTSHLYLRNPTNDIVIFKVKTTAPRQYCVRPNSGVLNAQEKAAISGKADKIRLCPFIDYDSHKEVEDTF